MPTAKLSEKGWLVIPADLRHRYGWKAGDHFNFVDYGGVISLQPVLRNPENEGMGALKGRSSLIKELQRERARERRREKRSVRH